MEICDGYAAIFNGSTNPKQPTIQIDGQKVKENAVEAKAADSTF